MTAPATSERPTQAPVGPNRRLGVRLLTWLAVLIPAAWGVAHAVAEALTLLF